MVLNKIRDLVHAVRFSYTDDGEEGSRMNVVELDRQLWEDMGRPKTITVTVRPGDLLNNHVS